MKQAPIWSAGEILSSTPKELRRFIARLQIEMAEKDRSWAEGGDPAEWPDHDEEIRFTKEVRQEVIRKTRDR